MHRFIFVFAALAFVASPVAGQDAHPGRAIFMNTCASCHGTDLQGGMGSNLVDDEWTIATTREEIVAVVREGIPESGMPPFGEALSDAQINQVVDFIQAASAGDVVILPSAADSLVALDYHLEAEVYVHGLEIPWAIDFTGPTAALITERPGRLRVVENGTLRSEPVQGTPAVLHEGQGGLLDVTVDPNYDENGWVYLAYSHLLPGEDSLAMTHIVRGRIENNRWTDEQLLYEAPHDTYLPTRQHYGSRIVFDPQGYLYFSIGDRGRQDMAQDLRRPNGKIHRIFPDGSIPPDNPFIAQEGLLPTIFSYGHRNPQGLAVHPVTGELWDVEHGPRGGDEINLIKAGRNYGWPIITYGINYSGTIITEERSRPGMEQPIFYWRPSIGVGGLNFYDGDVFPYWQNQALVTALRNQEVRVVQLHEGRVLHEETILKDAGRVREAVKGPDGAIYVVLNEPHVILRIGSRAGS